VICRFHYTKEETQLSIESIQRHLIAGNLIQLPANVPHAVKATQRFKMLLVMLCE